MPGSLEIGTLHVRRSNFIQASPARVWEEFTSFERLAAWFGQGHTLVEYEPRLGGRIRLFVEPNGEAWPWRSETVSSGVQ